MTFDPTTNRIPFELLTEDERVALKSWPHGWAYFTVNGWAEIEPQWIGATVYRGKPAPVVTSKWYNVYPNAVTVLGYSFPEEADEAADKTRIAVLRTDTCNGVSTAHLEDV
jgi:hypothetical protein